MATAISFRHLDLNPNIQLSFSEIEKDAKNSIGYALRKGRMLANFHSACEAAEFCSIKPSTLNAYECGRSRLPMHEAVRWSLLLGVSPYVIYSGMNYRQHLLPKPLLDETYLKLSFLVGRMNAAQFKKFIADLCFYLQIPIPSSQALDSIDESIPEASEQLRSKAFDNDYYLTVAKNLRKFRDHFGLSQRQVADMVQLRLERYRGFEKLSGEPKFECTMAARFHLGTGVAPVYLLQGSLWFKLRQQQEYRAGLLLPLLTQFKSDAVEDIINLAQCIISLKHLPNMRFYRNLNS